MLLFMARPHPPPLFHHIACSTRNLLNTIMLSLRPLFIIICQFCDYLEGSHHCHVIARASFYTTLKDRLACSLVRFLMAGLGFLITSRHLLLHLLVSLEIIFPIVLMRAAKWTRPFCFSCVSSLCWTAFFDLKKEVSWRILMSLQSLMAYVQYMAPTY